MGTGWREGRVLRIESWDEHQAEPGAEGGSSRQLDSGLDPSAMQAQ